MASLSSIERRSRMLSNSSRLWLLASMSATILSILSVIVIWFPFVFNSGHTETDPAKRAFCKVLVLARDGSLNADGDADGN